MTTGIAPGTSVQPGALSGNLSAATETVSELDSAPLAVVSDPEPGIDLAGAVNLGSAPDQSLSILVSFEGGHSTELTSLLTALSDPSSPQFHHYLTASQYDREFGGSSVAYRSAIAYFQSFGVTSMETYADRLSLSFSATTEQVQSLFHVTMERYAISGKTFVSPRGPIELPSPLASSIRDVEGLSTYSTYLNHPLLYSSLERAPPPGFHTPSAPVTGYLIPPSPDGTQLEYAPDFQVAYDEESLFNDSGFPKNAVVATILWSGQNSTSQNVAPFVPKDVYDFYNETIPAGEPHAHVYGVPLDGAPSPGPSASWDITGADVENTLDLEMVGSTAPGASIYNVYGPTASTPDLDQAFAYILNPTGTPGLTNVSVITNSWGGPDSNDTNWMSDLEEAQMRGITVLASSGDSGDSVSSPKYTGGPDWVEFPSAMAYNTFGDVAVGGSVATLDAIPSDVNFLHISAQSAWYDGGSQPVGSTGGVSNQFPEPSWQVDTSANSVIASTGSSGRGVPDIGALAANTLMTLTQNGFEYDATNATHGGDFVTVAGTSIASPLEAGVVAEMDHVLKAHSNGNLGFLDPLLYSLANSEFGELTGTSTTGYDTTGSYSSPLPTLPLLDVTTGANALYSALVGYDLVTGWGALDAYNYTMYFLEVSSTGVFGRLSGVDDDLTLTHLDVTSIGGSFNASVQQNFFLANSLGAPIYWIQNVIYITNVSGGWEMDYTGWVVYPFYGLYPDLTIYEYNFPAAQLVHLPSDFDVKTQLITPAGFDTQSVDFYVGSNEVTLPVPGAAYIIGSLGYNYSWQGVNYTNGPFPNNPVPGGLAPQFGLVGGPSGGLGDFMSPTSGALVVTIEPYGTSSYVTPGTETFGENIDQTGETAENLVWSPVSGNSWTLGVSSGSSTQGVLAYETHAYSVSFAESGLPTGTPWSVTLGGVATSSTTSSLSFPVDNGTFQYSISDVSGWHQTTLPYAGTIVVSGVSVAEPTLVFSRVTYPITFTESGLPTGETWYVNFTTGPSGFTLPTGSALAGGPISPQLFNGTYRYTVATNDGRFQAASPDTVTEKNGTPSSESVTFQFTYPVEFSESGLPTGTHWTVTLAGVPETSGSEYLNISAPNGSQPYTISDVPGWHQSTLPYSGSILVTGSNVAEPTLEFLQVTYTATFTETGLPTGAQWWVNLTSGSSFVSTSTSIQFPEPNGTYDFTLATVDKTFAATGGSLRVNGGPVSQPAAFSPYTFSVSFTVSGLPSGVPWFVNITGGASNSSVGTTVGFELTNGSYRFAVATSDSEYAPTSPTGSLQVNGAPTGESVSFHLVTFQVTFGEIGLPSGTNWAVTLAGTVQSSTGSSIAFTEPNGSWAYTIGGISGWHQSSVPYTGTLTVTGSNLTVATLGFQRTLYIVEFSATGLPTATTWWVNLTGGGSTGGTADDLTLAEPNGSFVFSIATDDKRFQGAGGSFLVAGENLTNAVLFFEVTFLVTFTETGLPSGTNWSVTMNGVVETSTTDTIQFSQANGSFPFTVGGASGYQPSPASGHLLVAGAPVGESLTFSAPSTGGSFLGLTPIELNALLGAVVLVAALLLAVALLRSRGRKRSQGPSVPKGAS